MFEEWSCEPEKPEPKPKSKPEFKKPEYKAAYAEIVKLAEKAIIIGQKLLPQGINIDPQTKKSKKERQIHKKLVTNTNTKFTKIYKIIEKRAIHTKEQKNKNRDRNISYGFVGKDMLRGSQRIDEDNEWAIVIYNAFYGEYSDCLVKEIIKKLR